jgi:hypothetical protein
MTFNKETLCPGGIGRNPREYGQRLFRLCRLGRTDSDYIFSIPFSDDDLIGCRRCQQRSHRDQSKQELAHHFLLLARIAFLQIRSLPGETRATENGTPMRMVATGLGIGAP